MFEALTDRIGGVLGKLRGRAKISEADFNDAMRDVRRALLEADVSLSVVKDFVNMVRERAIGEELWKSLTPGQLVVKHVRDCLIEIMGGVSHELNYAISGPTVVMMCGLNGAGKTTTTGKLALFLRNRGHKPLMVATDVYRPAAIQQLETLGKQLSVPVFQMGDQVSPTEIAKAAVEFAKANEHDFILVDSAGRLHIDEALMKELAETKQALDPDEVLLVVDAMTGQDAVQIAQQFNDQIGVTGLVMTKLDGDTRGGAALSVKHVTGCSIKFIGIGEKSSALELFHPERLAGRILGMGDVLGLIEKAEQAISEEEAMALERKIREDSFTLQDFLNQMQQIRKLGSIKDLLGMLPGIGPAVKDLHVDEKQFRHLEAIIQSMTVKERNNPDLLNASRRKRIAKGSGTQVSDVNRLVKQFEMMRQMMRMIAGPKAKKGKLPFPFKLPF